jgi:hypothetical protein
LIGIQKNETKQEMSILANFGAVTFDIQISNRTQTDIAFAFFADAANTIPVSQVGYDFKLTVRADNKRASALMLELDGVVDSNLVSFPYTLEDVANLKAGVYYYSISKTSETETFNYVTGKFLIQENLSNG